MREETNRSGSRTKHAVVIAGGGPTGLTLAAELALAGVDVVVVERRETQVLASARAGGLHARTIEAFDQRGIVERFLSAGRTAQITTFARVPLDISDFPTRHPYGLALRQIHIEKILAAWTAELGVPVAYGVDVIDFSHDEEGVDVQLSDGRLLRAQYLIGCDGGRSLIRQKAGIDFVGWDASTSYLIAEVEMSEAPPFGIRRGERGVYAMGPHEDGKRVGVVLVEDDVSVLEHRPTLDELRDAIVAVYGADFGLQSATYLSRFSDMARQASTYRRGRVLLAGDAAHVHSPVGGQGLNTGVQDAMNLGWKLGQVVQGVSPVSLLDTYHAERHPVGARVLQMTMALTALERGDARVEALCASLADVLAMDGARQLYGARLSGLDIHYDLGKGHSLLGRRMPDLEIVTERGPTRVYSYLHAARPVLLQFDDSPALDIAPWNDRVTRVHAKYSGEWQLPVLGVVAAPGAVLIRPDGYVAWVGTGTNAGLGEALTLWCGSGRSSAT